MPLEPILHYGSYRRDDSVHGARLPKSFLPLPYEDPAELGFPVIDYSSFRTPTQLPRLLAPLIESRKGSRLQVPRWSSGQETRRLKGDRAVPLYDPDGQHSQRSSQ
ncbi:unnamed protein product [Arctia plantaginis]|uniref:Uncharacterized protein n=1 Tax=Arctia plantaginis TaxID=874455 RepID=A0A8S0Z323_ARCPL|nr:unnamed protein product [Arctia plantaginis]